MPSRKPDARIQLLLDFAEQAYQTRAWHGTNLRGSLRGLTLEEALWRPGHGRHNIWEIALHTAYWKYTIWRKISGAKTGSFPRKGSNFPKLPDQPDAKAWKADLALLKQTHQDFITAVRDFPPAQLSQKPPKMKWRWEEYIYGIASHDLYHAGQIQLLKRLCRNGAN